MLQIYAGLKQNSIKVILNLTPKYLWHLEQNIILVRSLKDVSG